MIVTGEPRPFLAHLAALPLHLLLGGLSLVSLGTGLSQERTRLIQGGSGLVPSFARSTQAVIGNRLRQGDNLVAADRAGAAHPQLSPYSCRPVGGTGLLQRQFGLFEALLGLLLQLLGPCPGLLSRLAAFPGCRQLVVHGDDLTSQVHGPP